MARQYWESRMAMQKVTPPSVASAAGNGQVELGGGENRGGAWAWLTVEIFSWRKPNACKMMPLPPFSGERQQRLLTRRWPWRWWGKLSQWISGRPFSSGRRCTTCRGSPSRTPYGTSSPRHAPSDWGEGVRRVTDVINQELVGCRYLFKGQTWEWFQTSQLTFHRKMLNYSFKHGHIGTYFISYCK